MVLYAGFRGQRAATQLPATFTTTTPPRSLPYEFMTRIFPDKVPAQTFEFPALTICPETAGSIVSITTCYVANATTTTNCDSTGIYIKNTTFDGVNQTCIAINDIPGMIMSANTEADVLFIAAHVSNVSVGGASGVLVNAHGQGENRMDFDSYFAASAYTLTEGSLRKIYRIDLNDTVTVDYESKATHLDLNVNTVLGGSNIMPFEMEFRYPRLEYVYERTFFPLDANNWLGEVGGVAALLLFLHRAVMSILVIVMCRTDRYSFSRVVGKNEEGFERF
ncbi:hypothetical protein SmJEL517_g06217 [Synchytrium microbalum]|uniref:Uncharacterized protein n=1 Tax=Synchytrium microbalum TaxID=1806994 RepID=A0A507BRK0_9FUNG|nr:uncharacterized protein SmJEL517_g06217 [Synchytrium microbalum]TPX30158.1 hypothetical protein SmJEL517_g06217 [Synchytrium microbalum]